MITSGTKDDIVKIAAKEAFWNMPVSWLAKLCDFDRIDVKEVEGDVCAMLLQMVRHYTGQSNENCLNIVAKRFAFNDVSAVVEAQLCQLDGAIDVMDINDARKFEDAKKLAITREENRNDFVDSFERVRLAVVPF